MDEAQLNSEGRELRTHRQDRSHYYVGRCMSDAINEITALRRKLGLST